jgi:aryl-alcohol dehydrogenase-like predicted oxidoreductase
MRRRIARTDLEVYPLCLGGNVFGWTADESASASVLDRFRAAGGNFIDTADVYSNWVPGHSGGESESIIGRWMRSRGTRHHMVLATKVGKLTGLEGLAPATIRTAVDASLRRLGTDYIDIYYAHADDLITPIVETLRAFDEIVRAGKVRWIAASNFTAPRLREALDISAREGLASYVLLQPHHNLVFQTEYAGPLRDLCLERQVSCAPYFALASGFLTGKYGSGATIDSPRAGRATSYLDERGRRILDALSAVAARLGAPMPAVALAWLLADPTIVAPIASARNVAQLDDLLPATALELSPADASLLSGL